MSAFQIFSQPSQQALDNAANVLSGATLTFSLTGTNTPTNAYLASDLTNPVTAVTADAAGVFDPVYFDPDVVYRVVMKTSAGVTLQTWDPANENILSSDRIAANLDSLKRTAAEISAGVTPVNYAYAPGDVRRYGVVGDGVTDDSAAMADAISTGLPLDLGDLSIRIVTKLTFDQTGQRIDARGGGFLFDGTVSQRIADVSATSVEFHGVDFDGNSKQVKGCLVYVATDAAQARFINCKFHAVAGVHSGGATNVDSNNQYGLVISFYGVQGFEVSGCVFNDISNDNSGANGTTPTQGIAFSGGILFCTDDFATPSTLQGIPTSGSISNCLFKDIITVLGNGLTSAEQQIYMDADGIRFFGERATAQIKLPVLVEGCVFYDCAKRAVKNSEASDTMVKNIWVIATTDLQYPMICAVKVDGDNQIVDGVNVFVPSTAPIRLTIQSHNCSYLRVSNVEVNYCEQLWDLAPIDSGSTYTTRGWRISNLQASSCEFYGIRHSTTCLDYIDCIFSNIEVAAASGVHDFVGVGLAAASDQLEVTLENFRVFNGDVKLNGYGWTLRGIYQEIDDSSYAGVNSSTAMLEAGLTPGTSVDRRSVIEGYELNIKTLQNAYLSASRPYLFLLYGDRLHLTGIKLTVPETLSTSQSHGTFDGSDFALVDFEYSGQSYINFGTVFTSTTKRRLSILGARRIGGATASNEFLRLDKQQDCSISDVSDYRDSASGTINLVGGTVTAGKTYAYIIDGVRTMSSAATPVTSGATISQTNVVQF